MKPPTAAALAAVMGLDWAEAQHDVCLQAAGTVHRECLRLEHSPEEMHAWLQPLRTRFNGHPVAVCLALNTGPIVSALRNYDFLVRLPVKPFTVAKYREAFTPSRAQDDPTDAARQVESRLKPRAKRPPLRPQSPPLRALAPLVAQRRRLVGDTVRLTNRLPSALQNAFPHVLRWLQDKAPALFGAFLRRWPTLNAAPLARRPTRERFFRAHHVRSADVITTRIEALQSAVARTPDAGVITPTALLGHALVAQRRVPLPVSADFASAIAQRAQEPPDCSLFEALPGAGAVFAPRLLGAFGEQRERDASAEDLQKYAGMAPVTERSGKQSWGPWRLQGPKFLRQTVGAWAAESLRHAFWAQGYYQQQRAKGTAHQAAVRAVACQWRRILYRCWQARTPHHEALYLQALKRRSAPLLHHVAH